MVNKQCKLAKILFLSLFLLSTSFFKLSAQEIQSDVAEVVENIDDSVEAFANAVSPEQDELALIPEETKDYVIEQTEEGETIFIQTLTWDASAYASKYDIVIEKQGEDGEWTALDEEYSSTESSIKVSLYAGMYRYKVYVYNLLGMQDSESEWFNFDVFKAIKPEINSFSSSILYLDEENSDIFTFNGDDILNSTEFSLQIPNEPQRTLFGSIVESSRNSYRIQFDLNKIDVGTYVFIAENPGGLTSDLEFTVNSEVTEDSQVLDVKFLKPYDFNVSLGYAPYWTPPSGEIYEYFATSFLPVGATLRLTYIPLKRNYGQFGFELTGYWNRLWKDYSDYGINTHAFTGTLNFVYQLPLIKKKLVLDTHVGAGATYFMNFMFEFESGVISPALNVLAVTGNGGIAMQLYVARRLYLELGADYLISLLKDSVFQAVVPQFSVGWQF